MRGLISSCAVLLLALLWPMSAAQAYTCNTTYYFGEDLSALMQRALEDGDYLAVEGGRLLMWFPATASHRDAAPESLRWLSLDVTEDVESHETLNLLRGEITWEIVADLSAPARWYLVLLWTADEAIGSDTQHEVRTRARRADPVVVRFDQALAEVDEAAIDEWLAQAEVELTLEPPSVIHEEECCVIRGPIPCAAPRRDVVEESCRGRVLASLPTATVSLSDTLPVGLPFVAVRVEVPFADTGFEAIRARRTGAVEVSGGGSYRQNVIGPGGRVSQPISVERPEVCLQALRLSMTDDEPTPVGEAHCRTLEVPESDAEWIVGERRGGDSCEGVDTRGPHDEWYEPSVHRGTRCLDEGTGLCALLPEEPEWPPIPEEDFSEPSDDPRTGSEEQSGESSSSDVDGDEGSSGCSKTGGPGGSSPFALLLLGLLALRRARLREREEQLVRSIRKGQGLG